MRGKPPSGLTCIHPCPHRTTLTLLLSGSANQLVTTSLRNGPCDTVRNAKAGLCCSASSTVCSAVRFESRLMEASRQLSNSTRTYSSRSYSNAFGQFGMIEENGFGGPKILGTLHFTQTTRAEGSKRGYAADMLSSMLSPFISVILVGGRDIG